ncbi:P-loop containing nucleoside triphosphate hydrolase protein, partial [Hyaloscypha bicolor E]
MESIIYALLQLIPSLLKAEHVGLLVKLFAITSASLSLFYFVKSYFMTTVRISESDILAQSLLSYCAKTHHAKHRKSLTAASVWPEEDDIKIPLTQFRNFKLEERKAPPKYEPDFGSTWKMEYGVSVQRVSREPEKKAGGLVLHYFGRSLTPIENLLKLAAKEDFERHRNDNLVVYPESEDMIRQCSPDDAWAVPIYRRGRSMDTVCMRQGLKDQILGDIQSFTSYKMQERYFASGIPYRRGYLFYGSRGTGKTSLYKALALRTGLRLYLVNVAELELTDNSLQKLFAGIPRRCIVILEEVDPTQLRRSNNVSGIAKKNGISLSGLKSAIDGPLTPEGHLLIITTNFCPKDFPQELIRPGRVDLAIEFKKASVDEAIQLFKTAYLQSPEDELKEHIANFSIQASLLKDSEFSHAELQGFFLTARTPQNASKTFRDWVEQERKKGKN